MATFKEKDVLIKEAKLTNNCPECFSNEDLILYFHQRIKSNRFYMKVTDSVTKTIVCNKCKSTIYPVNWTDDIERVFDYFDKMVKPKKASLKFTSVTYIITILSIILIAAVITLLLYKEII